MNLSLTIIYISCLTPTINLMFEFIKLEFLIDSNQPRISQIQSSSLMKYIDTFNESKIVTTEGSYESSSKIWTVYIYN